MSERLTERRREMRLNTLPWWQLLPGIRGADGDEDEGDDTDEDADEDEDSDEGDEDSDDDDDGDDDDDSDEDNEKLLKTLRKERKTRREAERRAKKAERELDKKSKKEGTDKEKAAEAEAKAKRLAARLERNAVDLEITKIATNMKFRDIDDALALIDRDEIDVDQDEDEPEDVVVDRDTVKEALKALAKKKPHLIKVSDDEDDDTDFEEVDGGTPKMRGKKKKGDPMSEEALKETYPGLNR